MSLDSQLVLEATFDGKKAKDGLAKFNKQVDESVVSSDKLDKSLKNVGSTADKSVKNINKISNASKLLKDEVQKSAFEVAKLEREFKKAQESTSITAKELLVLEKNLKKAQDGYRKTAIQAKVFSDNLIKANATAKKIDTPLKKMNTGIAKTGKTSLVATKSMGSFIDVLAKAYVAMQALGFAYDNTVKKASQLEEVNNLLGVIASPGGQETIDQFNEIIDQQIRLGALSELSAKKITGSFANIFNGLSFGGDAMAELSGTLTQMTVDFASFYDLSFEEAQNKLTSGLVGESEPLKQIGILLTEAQVANYALANGIKKANVELTEQEKVLIRLALIQEKSVSSVGDFARTSDSFSNSIKVAQTNIEALGLTIGAKLIPALLPTVQAFTEFTTNLNSSAKGSETLDKAIEFIAGSLEVLRAVFTSIVSVIGVFVDLFDDLATSIFGTGNEVEGMTKAWGLFSDIILTILQTLKFLVVGLVDTSIVVAKVTGDIVKALTFQGVDFSGTKDAFAQFDKNFKENIKDINDITAKAVEKEVTDGIEKGLKNGLEKPQLSEIKLDTSVKLDIEVDTKELEKVAEQIKPVLTDIDKLKTLSVGVQEGDVASAEEIMGFYGTYYDLVKANDDLKGNMLKSDKEALDLLNKTLPLVGEVLKKSNIEIQIQKKKVEYSKDIVEYYDQEIERLESITVNVGKASFSLKDMARLTADIAYQTKVMNNYTGDFTKKEQERAKYNKEYSERIVAQLEGNKLLTNELNRQRDIAEKTALAIATWEVAVAPALDATNGLFDSISKGIEGDITGSIQSALGAVTGILETALPGLGGLIGGAISGLYASITALVSAVSEKQAKKDIAKIQAEKALIDKQIVDLENEIQALLKNLEVLNGLNDIETKKRETERAKYEAELLKAGKSELEIKEALRKFDQESADLRIKQIAEEKQRALDAQAQLKKNGVDVFDAEGNLDEEKIKEALKAEEDAIKNQADLNALLEEYQRLQSDAGSGVTYDEEKRAENLAGKLKDLLGVDIFGNYLEENFSAKDLEKAIEAIQKDITSGELDILKLGISQEQIDLINSLEDLDKEQAEIELGLIQDQIDLKKEEAEKELALAEEKAQIEQEILDERNAQIDRQFEYLAELRKEQGGDVTASSQLVYKLANQGQLERATGIQTSTSNINTQINNNVTNNTSVSI